MACELTPEQKSKILHDKLISIGKEIQQIARTGATLATDKSKLSQFRGMYRTVEGLYKQFLSVQDSLVELHILHSELPAFPSETATSNINVIKRYHCECHQHYEDYVSSPIISGRPDISLNQTQHPAPSKAHLPKLNLPKFSGKNFTDWPLFRDTYVSLVHNDESLSPIEKFHYLLSSLTEPALSTVKSISLTGDNYQQAWTAVIKQFDNQRKLASTYVDKILTYKPPPTKSVQQSLQNFLTHVDEHVTSLQNMKIADLSDFLLFELAIRHVDPKTREAFELNLPSTTDFPKFSDLKSFIESRYQALSLLTLDEKSPESTSSPKLASPSKFQPKIDHNRKNSFFAKSSSSQGSSSHHSPSQRLTHKSTFSCFLCSEAHILPRCPRFISGTPQERLTLLRNFPGCLNCLHPLHTTEKCGSKVSCRVPNCNQRHHTTLHQPTTPKNALSTSRSSCHTSSPPAAVLTSLSSSQVGEVLLGTAQVQILDSKGSPQIIRIVVDSGSQLSFASQSCIDRLGLSHTKFSKPITGVGLSNLTPTLGKVDCVISPRTSSHPQIRLTAVIIEQITSCLPQSLLPRTLWEKYLQFDLADPMFWQPGPIDLLLGADTFIDILLSGPITPYPNEPSLMNTLFGHIIIGRHGTTPGTAPTLCGLTTSATSVDEIASYMRKFWEVEEIPPSTQFLSPADEYCENHFRQTHKRLPCGRYQVELPFKTGEPPSLGPSRSRALSCLYHLESRFHRNEKLRHEYTAFLREYEDLHHMEVAREPGAFIIPHHGVFKSGTESKIRVVFNASARTSKGSLNDHLHIGPKLQIPTCLVLLRFRRHLFVISGDFNKMYRQILLAPQHRKYQHILWRANPSQPVTEYELLTVTYGMAPSAYLSHRTVEQLVEDEGQVYPNASQALLNDRYVDDVPTGANSIEEALSLRNELIELLSKGGFTLGKWCSSDPRLLAGLQDTSTNPVDLSSDNTLKILGCQWNPLDDMLSYKITPFETSLSKRSILSTIARIYDPLGYLTPVIFMAKIILQDTWKSGVDWDEPVPLPIETNWRRFSQDLHQLSQLRIPRYLQTASAVGYDIVGFCDASERGYCACIYLRVHLPETFSVFLLQAKTKLAPHKTCFTIPRLELCGSSLLVQLFDSLVPFFKNFNILNYYFFTDSTIVLAWLRTSPNLLKIFVAHRITSILKSTKLEWWHHIRSESNPADCGSRGLFPSQLKSHPLWWSGPKWLTRKSQEWPISNFSKSIDPLPELKSPVVLLATPHSFFICWTEKFSSYLTLIRTLSFVLRFCKNSHLPKEERTFGTITTREFSDALHRCILLLQQHYYSDRSSRKCQDLFASLNVFEDQLGFLRVGGRLMLSQLPFSQRHPLLLPKQAHFSKILVRYLHKINLHPGSQFLHSLIQQKYWIPGCRSLIRQVKMQCLVCHKFSQKQVNPYMGNLPASRLSTERAFFNTGVDFAGPLLCKESARRNARSHKAYICLFICFSSKAIHLEVVPNLSTEGFLDALDRFIARRGTPAHLFSDNGSNFLGASRYLKEVGQWLKSSETIDGIVNYCSPKSIKWSFNPPRSPHFGGLWESGIKSVKSHLYKVLGNHPFTERELSTIITKIEGILNNRPLIPISSDPEDPSPLTPAHLLIGGPIHTLPEPDFAAVPPNRLSRWQFLRERAQAFWKHWARDYLNTLQARRKWTKHSEGLKTGDLVLLRQESLSPFQWPLGRVSHIHPGPDGIVRVATIQTSSGTFQRAVHRLIPLTPVVVVDPSSSSES